MEASRPERDADARGSKILIVDDNPDIVTLTRKILEQRGYEIVTAADGHEALDQVEREVPDLVLLDVMLPGGVNGMEVCRRIKGDHDTRQIMVLLMTGCGSLDHRVKGLESGADDYITKPFHLTELLARVRSALRIKDLNDEIAARNRELLKAQKERLRSEKMAMLGLLATGIAHEFNNIMSGIAGYAQLALKNPQYKDDLVNVTITQAERAMKIANTLSTFYRPSATKTPTDIRQVVEDTTCLVAKQLKERHVRLERRFEEIPPLWIHPSQVQEVVLNLFINAIDAIGKQGTITVAAERNGEDVVLSISDTGCGIAEDVQERIFDPFFTTKGALGGGGASGSGLGLSMSYNIIKSHGGDVRVTSREGEGTTFVISLPIDAPEGRDGENLAGPRLKPGSKILIGDSDDAAQDLARKYLREIDIVGCASWDDTLEGLRSQSVDLILLDADLPGPGTFEENFDNLLASHPDVAVVLTSSNLSNDELRRCLSRAQGHLLKPYTVENLTNLLEFEGQ